MVRDMVYGHLYEVWRPWRRHEGYLLVRPLRGDQLEVLASTGTYKDTGNPRLLSPGYQVSMARGREVTWVCVNAGGKTLTRHDTLSIRWREVGVESLPSYVGWSCKTPAYDRLLAGDITVRPL